MPEPCWCKVLVMVQGLVSSSGAGDMLVEYMFYCSVSGQVESSTLNHEIFQVSRTVTRLQQCPCTKHCLHKCTVPHLWSYQRSSTLRTQCPISSMMLWGTLLLNHVCIKIMMLQSIILLFIHFVYQRSHIGEENASQRQPIRSYLQLSPYPSSNPLPGNTGCAQLGPMGQGPANWHSPASSPSRSGIEQDRFHLRYFIMVSCVCFILISQPVLSLNVGEASECPWCVVAGQTCLRYLIQNSHCCSINVREVIYAL